MIAILIILTSLCAFFLVANLVLLARSRSKPDDDLPPLFIDRRGNLYGLDKHGLPFRFGDIHEQ